MCHASLSNLLCFCSLPAAPQDAVPLRDRIAAKLNVTTAGWSWLWVGDNLIMRRIHGLPAPAVLTQSEVDQAIALAGYEFLFPYENPDPVQRGRWLQLTLGVSRLLRGPPRGRKRAHEDVLWGRIVVRRGRGGKHDREVRAGTRRSRTRAFVYACIRQSVMGEIVGRMLNTPESPMQRYFQYSAHDTTLAGPPPPERSDAGRFGAEVGAKQQGKAGKQWESQSRGLYRSHEMPGIPSPSPSYLSIEVFPWVRRRPTCSPSPAPGRTTPPGLLAIMGDTEFPWMPVASLLLFERWRDADASGAPYISIMWRSVLGTAYFFPRSHFWLESLPLSTGRPFHLWHNKVFGRPFAPARLIAATPPHRRGRLGTHSPCSVPSRPPATRHIRRTLWPGRACDGSCRSCACPTQTPACCCPDGRMDLASRRPLSTVPSRLAVRTPPPPLSPSDSVVGRRWQV